VNAAKKPISPTGRKFHEYLSALMEASDLTQIEMARELGYTQQNLISMFKRGVSKVPVDKLPKFAEVLGVDPAHFTRIALREYYPDFYASLEKVFGPAVTRNEFEIIQKLRKLSRNTDPNLSGKMEIIEKALEKAIG
jgi:transcriptional regulator with XRE-family HTH domain